MPFCKVQDNTNYLEHVVLYCTRQYKLFGACRFVWYKAIQIIWSMSFCIVQDNRYYLEHVFLYCTRQYKLFGVCFLYGTRQCKLFEACHFVWYETIQIIWSMSFCMVQDNTNYLEHIVLYRSWQYKLFGTCLLDETRDIIKSMSFCLV